MNEVERLREFVIAIAAQDTYVGRIAKLVLRGMTVDEAQCAVARAMRETETDRRKTEERILFRRQRIGKR